MSREAYAARTGTAFAGTAKAKVDDGQELVGRLHEARQRLEEFSKESSRLSGELGAARKRCDELEAKCQADFGCSTAELPGLVADMKAVAEAKTAEAEVALGMREPEPEPEADQA